MNRAQNVSVIAIFTSLAIVTDYAMAPIPNVKLVFTLTFSSAYAFGFKIGLAVAVLTELIWGMISPEGFGGLIIPFLVGANIIYAIAGWGASKIWGYDIKPFSQLNIFFGSILAVCAFCWDSITNFGYSLFLSWPHPSLVTFLAAEVTGIPFMILHEIGDFVLGSALAPVIILYFLRVFGKKKILVRKESEEKETISVSGTNIQNATTRK